MEEIGSIKSIFDLIKFVVDDRRIEQILHKYISNADIAFEKSDGNFLPIEKNEQNTFFNLDLELFIHSLIMYLKDEDVDTNSLFVVRNLFDKVNKKETAKNTYMLIAALSYTELVPQPKAYFYFKILFKNKKTKKFSAFNSFGFNRAVLIKYLGEEVFKETFEVLGEHSTQFKKLAIGQKRVNTLMKAEALSESDILDYSNYLEDY